ncbi:MAG: hypothetical protein ACREM8_02650 [Vulcanimicrobiaceae bacterium]
MPRIETAFAAMPARVGDPGRLEAESHDSLPAAGSNLADALARAEARNKRDAVALERRHLAFDSDVSRRAEDDREFQLLQTLAMQRLKDEDEIVKKWISMA